MVLQETLNQLPLVNTRLSSAKTYLSPLKRWIRYSQARGLDQLAFTIQDYMLEFISFLYHIDVLPKAHLDALGWAARALGLDYHIPPKVAELSVATEKAIRAARVNVNVIAVPKTPFKPYWLRYIPITGFEDPNNIVVSPWSLSVLLVFLASSTMLRGACCSRLKWQHYNEKNGSFFYTGAKQDPVFKGQEVVVLPTFESKFWDLRRFLELWGGATGKRPQDYILFDVDAWRATGVKHRLKTPQLRKLFHELIDFIYALPPGSGPPNLPSRRRVVLHSCRYGGATALFDAGFSVDAVAVIGNWKSDVVRTYLRFARELWTPGPGSQPGDAIMRYTDPMVDSAVPR